MIRALIIAGVLLAAIGAGCLYWCRMDARQDQADSARFEAKHAGQTQEFIRKVNEQVAKGNNAKLDFSWLKDGKSAEERQQEQHERLLADIARLAAGAEPLYPEILYGSNWRDEVEQYKTDVYQRDMIQIGSVGLLIAGGLLMSLGLFLVVVAAVRNIWRQGSVEGKTGPDDTADKIKAEMKTAFADFAGDMEARQKQMLTNLTENVKPGMPGVTSEAVTAKFDESLSRFGKGLQNRLEGLISRIESAYNAGSKRNDEMLNHMSALLKEQGTSLEKITAEIETIASSFMSELAMQGRTMSEQVNESFKEHGENLARETASLKDLVASIDRMVTTAHAGTKSELGKALTELRRDIVADLSGGVTSSGSGDLKDLIEKVEAVMAVGPSVDVRGELERTLNEFREAITLDLASLTCKDTETLQQLIAKVETALERQTGVSCSTDIEQAFAELRSGISADITSAAAVQTEAINELKTSLENAPVRQTGDAVSAADLAGRIDKALGDFRDSITIDLADLTGKDMDSLKELVADIKSAVSGSRDSGVQLDSDTLVAQLRESIAADVTAQADAIGRLSATVERLAGQKSADSQSQLQGAIDELKEQLAAQTAAVNDSLSAAACGADNGTADRFDELLSAVRNSDAAITTAADRILARIEELSSVNTAEQLASIISAGDTAVGVDAVSDTSTGDIAAATLSKAEAIEKNVEEACRQIHAIREYASRQQDRMERLQDGYDWNIIGNFCIRIIRCVDNLDDRIAELTIAGQDTRHLQVLRDELLFAMESSGVERFEVAAGTDFRGQEHRLKAQGQREVTDNTELVGKVALVIRPGYQCYISEDSTKTVRPAEVRVYGTTSVEEIAIGGSAK